MFFWHEHHHNKTQILYRAPYQNSATKERFQTEAKENEMNLLRREFSAV